MRLQKYITEADQRPEVWEEITSSIEKNCQPFLKDLKGSRSLLYRGLSHPVLTIMVLKSLQDRKPRFVDRDLHQRMNDYFKKTVGWNVRSEGLFVSCDESIAYRFTSNRSIGIVFPIGNYKCVWNPNISSLYSAYDQYDARSYVRYASSNSEGRKMTREEAEIEIYNETILPHLKNYASGNLKRYLKEDSEFSECIIKCDKYYLINYTWKSHLLAKYSE